MKNYRRPSPNRAICWGDKLMNRGATYGMRPRTIFFRHLPSTDDAVFAFGKHRGENVKEVDDLNYMMWATGSLPLQDYQRKVLEQKITLDLNKILGKIAEKPQNIHKKQPMKKLTFATAVLDTLCDFTTLGQDFSAYDVTRSLRQKVNNGEITVLDGTPTTFKGRTTTSIPHYTTQASNGDKIVGVQEIVHDIFKQNDMTGYTAQDTGNYILYVCDTPAPVVAAPVSPLGSAIGNALTNLTAAASKTPAPAKRSAIGEAIDNYVFNQCGLKGVAPTLKQIQSAIKRKGQYTCQEIRDEAVAYGLKVKSNVHLSKSTVSR